VIVTVLSFLVGDVPVPKNVAIVVAVVKENRSVGKWISGGEGGAFIKAFPAAAFLSRF
jgi:hypothetical protein